MLAAYQLYMRLKLRGDPAFTIQSVNFKVRQAWVEKVMADTGKDVLAVQTLRNSTMAATLMASTAVFLIIGALTLSAQGDKLNNIWHALNIFGDTRRELWMLKVLLIVVDFLFAFFSFSMSVRLYNHIGYMIHSPILPAHVAMYLNRAGNFYSYGMRAYYFSVPLIFWFFGPHLMIASTLALICFLYNMDKTPDFLAEDFRAAVKPASVEKQ
ncbi:MAG: DUF599 domain-containing protein [Nitrospinae bacterium]|nr:DUF599 domain-containing protein [Nitrospinota bacterium]